MYKTSWSPKNTGICMEEESFSLLNLTLSVSSLLTGCGDVCVDTVSLFYLFITILAFSRIYESLYNFYYIQSR